MYDLLDDPLIPSQLDGVPNPAFRTLPGLYAQLAADKVHSFPGLAAHQAPAWYQFLAQLGAIAVHRGGLAGPPTRADEWRSLLADLAADHTSTAWSLVGRDARKPALLQPPTDRLEEFRTFATTADALDLLVKSKNHDRKQTQAVHAPPHLWLYALVNLQTTQGYSGRGQPGVARMNGGLSSRPLVDLRPSARWGPRVFRAVRMLLARREQVLKTVGDDLYRRRDGLALTWLRRWDDDQMLSLGDLDPYFVEVCRRLRLVEAADGRLCAVARPSRQPRTNAKAAFGNLGDPWVPVALRKDPPAALTVGAGGFDYRLVQRIVLRPGEFRRPLALQPLPGERDGNKELHLAALVRGQGKTEGFHERVIPLPDAVWIHLGFDADDADDDDAGDSSLAELSDAMVDRAGDARKVLRQSVLVFLQGPEHPDFRKPDARSIVSRFDRRVDEVFFEFLFETAPKHGFAAAETRWERFLYQTASTLAKEAWRSLTAPAARREKARAAAAAVLFGGLRKRLPKGAPSSPAKETDL